KTRSSQTIGLALPRPGMAVFHLTFFSGLHSSGGFAAGATPVISGPRHCGQLPSAASRARADAAKEATTREASGTSFSVILNSMVELRCVVWVLCGSGLRCRATGVAYLILGDRQRAL